MQEDYRKCIEWWLNEFGAVSQLNHYIELFPELDSRLAKFTVGIFIWNMLELIDINNTDDVSKVRMILKVIDQTPGYDFFDNVFNGSDPDTVCGILSTTFLNPVDSGDIKFNYSIHEIQSFKDAHSYSDAVSWCIVISEESYNAYTANGNQFYFCCNDGWKETESVPGCDFPHDHFGYSLIAVEVTPDNEIASVTSRWNTCDSTSRMFLSRDKLREVLGQANFCKLFSKPEEDGTKH